MPKSSHSSSPRTLHSNPKSSGDDNSARLSDVALRKKKNADAQAAFRARRANYIATLEEAVNNLESAVVELQQSCQEARSEASEHKAEAARLRHEFREREKYWRALWQSRRHSVDDLPPPHPSTSSTGLIGDGQLSAGTSQGGTYSEDNGLGYRPEGSSCQTPFSPDPNSYTASPLLEGPEGPINSESGSRMNKYGGYSYPPNIHGSPRDSRGWPSLQGVIGVNNNNNGESGTQTPIYTESPTLATPDMAGFAGYPAEEQKPTIHGVLERATYSFTTDHKFPQRLGVHDSNDAGGSRSLSPNTASNATGTTGSLTSPFSFSFADTSTTNDRRDFDFRRHSLPHSGVADFVVHGGTADISGFAEIGPDAARYRPIIRKEGLAPGSSSLLSGNQSLSVTSDQGDGDDVHGLAARLRKRRGTAPSSRSPSPSVPSVSCTVAVIKAQAFGALRRTRARGKKSSEGAAKVAMDVLAARGIGIGGPSTGSKRQRTDSGSMDP